MLQLFIGARGLAEAGGQAAHLVFQLADAVGLLTRLVRQIAQLLVLRRLMGLLLVAGTEQLCLRGESKKRHGKSGNQEALFDFIGFDHVGPASKQKGAQE